MAATFSARSTRAIQRAILHFFDQHQRALPWRSTRDPYRIWVSEVMLQQTRVETAVPYYERWLERFPDIDRLAAASPDDVLHAWAGLGYYTRARNLHRGAQLVRERGGQLPGSARELRTLPGIGEYTAGAIASIAFGERAAAVDGNVRRVLCRTLDADLDAATLRRTASMLVPATRAGDFNQGLMELGATICRPRRPLCGACPVRRHCRARAAGTQALRPSRDRRPPTPEHELVALVLHSPAGMLLTRSSGGLLAGMWRFPDVALQGDVPATARRAIRRITGVRAARVQGHGVVRHAFSHCRHQYHVVSAALAAPAIARGDAEWRWTPAARLDELPLPAAQRRIATLAHPRRQ
ncbi:MAG TPA: A/G-specific adenine glycosylase [Longimicrobiales bacterium]|nr:A/G-specific adenine glycosylase [Longimicrobiales bacterium]